METTTFNPDTAATWTRERGTAELSSFVMSRLANLSDVDLELV